MSRTLPPRPSLEFLKKQAKEHLRVLQQRDPRARLVEAQHEIAREYGFASWPKLRAHVESLAQQQDAPAHEPSPQPSRGGHTGGGGAVATGADEMGGMFRRFTHKARQATFFSRYEASQLGTLTIEPESLLLGLIRASQDLKGYVFDRAHLPLDQARAHMAQTIAGGRPLDSSVLIPFSDGTKHILRAAMEEADGFGHHDIGIAHLLLGILRERPVAASILTRNGIRLESVRSDIDHLIAQEA